MPISTFIEVTERSKKEAGMEGTRLGRKPSTRMMQFETSVFINCPFDDAYSPLLRPILFVVIDLGFTPRIALETLNSGRPRFEKIVSLIDSRSMQFTISRASRPRRRVIMPFELGLDVGCSLFKPGHWAEKKCLVLEAEQYRYQAALSDISNSDIASHGNEPVRALTEVRNWLNYEARLRAPGPAAIWARFTDFMTENYDLLTDRGYSPQDIEKLPVAELIDDMQRWIEQHPP